MQWLSVVSLILCSCVVVWYISGVAEFHRLCPLHVRFQRREGLHRDLEVAHISMLIVRVVLSGLERQYWSEVRVRFP